MTVAERNALLEASVPVDPGDPHSRRYVVRRTPHGIELYDLKWTRDVDGGPEFHGHPATYVPGGMLKRFRDNTVITAAEYKRLRKQFGQ